jgi:N-acetylglucosamine malate deacetylase 1
MRILAVAAHPDDLELLCAGTLAKYAQQGHSVTMGIACCGDKGSATIPPDELSRIRAGEAQASAAQIGATAIILGFKDMGIHPEQDETKLKFVDLVRQAVPEVVITHSPMDYNLDHIHTAELVKEASFYASVVGVRSSYPVLGWVPPVYYMDTVTGVGFSPEEYVDITATLEVKVAMMSQHRSQLDWLQAHDKSNPLDMIRTVARFRGLQCDAEYAEGFVPYRAWRRNFARRLLP